MTRNSLRETVNSAAGIVGDGNSSFQELAETYIDGVRAVMTFSPNHSEFDRRRSIGLGAVTDRRLLHALWELPYGVNVPASSLRPHDVETLEKAHGHVTVSAAGLTRRYSPPGIVHSVFVATKNIAAAVQQVATFPSIYERIAVGASASVASDVLNEARRLGIGIVSISPDGDGTLVKAPEPAERGRPAVYRWWIEEVVFRNVLMQRIEPTE